MTFYVGAVVSVVGLWAHHPAITIVGIGLMLLWLINQREEAK